MEIPSNLPKCRDLLNLHFDQLMDGRMGITQWAIFSGAFNREVRLRTQSSAYNQRGYKYLHSIWVCMNRVHTHSVHNKSFINKTMVDAGLNNKEVNERKHLTRLRKMLERCLNANSK